MTPAVPTTDEKRLHALLDANRSIVGELSLPGVLRRIVEAAREVAGARYAALGVIGVDGFLEQFVHSGMDSDTVRAIGAPPRGHGVLGALIREAEPIRLSSLGDDPRFRGFPAGHPPMRGFLGVPIRSHESVFGNLYLGDRRDGGDFDQQDLDLVLALAATAGIAVENARLYEESRRRQEWLRASGEISRDLLAPHQRDEDVLRRVATSVQRLADANLVLILLPVDGGEGELEVAAATGDGAGDLLRERFAEEPGLAGAAMRSGRGLQADATATYADVERLGRQAGAGPVMALPLTGEGRARGAVVLARSAGRRPFAGSDLVMAETFAGQAALALELAEARADQQRLTVLEDRDRIARDLHDHVIQRLFAIGLTVQSVAAAGPAPAEHRLQRAVADLDETIRQIRSSIFALREDRVTAASVRTRALDLVEELGPTLGLRPAVTFRGPLDTLLDAGVIDDVEAVLREALTNVAKHARARSVTVVIAVADGRLEVTVLDDGVGINPEQPRSGLANLRSRAEQYGGGLAVDNRQEGGLRLAWSIPLAI